ncbi:hypothetical protein [Mycobacterium paraense]|uniref:hypothetical protein n=1 Tax=Mycobacterium paraense TaxID=767916 RepID=UPI00111C0085|nr:hypothetical protein [Mycobacterium paraense]
MHVVEDPSFDLTLHRQPGGGDYVTNDGRWRVQRRTIGCAAVPAGWWDLTFLGQELPVSTRTLKDAKNFIARLEADGISKVSMSKRFCEW